MPLRNLTYEKVNELKKQMKEKEYKTLNKKSAEKYMKWIKC